MPTGLHATASATEHTDWQILVSVAVAVCDSAAVQTMQLYNKLPPASGTFESRVNK